MALVKNLHGTADNHPPYGYETWEEYWEINKGRRFSKCSCVSCFKLAAVGGHVKMVYGTNRWFIVPLCSEHNSYAFNGPYEVADGDLLAVNL